MIRVLVVDDRRIIREALGSLLQTAGDIQIVATAANGQEAITQATLHYPDVTIMDISMPLMDGITAARQICSDGPQTRVLMLSMHPGPHYVRRSLRAGAFGYVLKDMAGDDLVTAVHSLYQGNRYFSQQVAGIAEYYL